jgi:phage recombination protein Bet
MTNDLIVIEDSKVALIKRTVAKDATDDELELFLHQARRMGLDPLARQIHFQKFKNKKTGKYNVSFITTIDGYRLIADRTGVYAGSDDPVFEGRIEDSAYGAGKGPNIPAKATVTVYKIVAGTLRAFANSAYWQEYYPGEWRGHMWRKMPHVMLAKVAEAGALRKAFPADLSGVYTADEMQQSSGEIVDAMPQVDAPSIPSFEEVMKEPEPEADPLPSHSIANLRATIEGAKDDGTGKVTLGFVCNRATATGHYRSTGDGQTTNADKHAFNAAMDWPGWPEENGKFSKMTLKMSSLMPIENALELFDWLVERKQEAAKLEVLKAEIASELNQRGETVR